jgi:glutathione S-transferase
MNLQTLKSTEYLAINPGGTVPLLLHDDLALTENIAILEYLAELRPEARLLGDHTPRTRAEVMRWLGLLNSDVHTAFKPIFTPARFLHAPDMAPELAEVARTRIREYLERLDLRLEGRDWLTDERSVADPYLFVLLRWSVNKRVGLDRLDNLERFSDRMYQDVGVKAALAAEKAVSANETRSLNH